MSSLFTDTIRKTGGSLGTDIRIKNTSVYESDGGTSVTQNLVQGVLKAWSQITTHSAIGDSLNLSSVTDQGTGQSNDNLTNPFANTDYCITYGLRDGGGTNDDRILMSGTSEQFTTSKYGLYCFAQASFSGSLNDADFVFQQYSGDLA